MQFEISDQAKLGAALINNIGIAVAREGGDAVDTGIAMLRRAIGLNPLDCGHRLNLASFLLGHGADDPRPIQDVAARNDVDLVRQVLGGRIARIGEQHQRAADLHAVAARQFMLFDALAVCGHRIGRSPGEAAVVLVRSAQRKDISECVQPALVE